MIQIITRTALKVIEGLAFIFFSIPAGLTLAGVTHRLPNGRTLNDQPMILGISWGCQQVARNCQKTCQGHVSSCETVNIAAIESSVVLSVSRKFSCV